MYNKITGELTYHYGWEKKANLTIFNRSVEILVMFTAYYEKDDLTAEQEIGYLDFFRNRSEYLEKTEKALYEISADPEAQFTLRFLLFQRNGEFALLFDDEEDPDDGIAVRIKPEMEIFSQDQYL